MTGSGWGAPAWRAEGEQREGLPQIEDLPIAEHGYDQEAVREAFDRFYRHAAQLDSTLRVLESVEAFSRQARDLRADIRSLRAASWGPAPSARHVWSVGHEAWAPEEPPAALAASLPRLALWAALIVAVGVGAALADLRTVVIVAFVLGAWVLVGLIELVIASRRATRLPAPLAPQERTAEPVATEPAVAALPAAEPAAQVAPEVVAPQETMISTPGREPADAEDEEVAEPSPVERAGTEDEAVAEPPAVEPEVAPVEAPAAAEEAVAAATEPAAVPAGEAEAPKRGGLFRRRREQPIDDTDPQLQVADLAPGAWRPDESADDPWEQGVGENGEREPVEAAVPPARGLLRRGRR
jgi:hypothetical protein